MANSPAREVSDAARWWQAYSLAESGEVDELRQRADGGDVHARRQLAYWISERGRSREAIALIRPLADAGEDIAQLWLARWLAECDQAGELRLRADAGDEYALYELAGWLAARGRLTELGELVSTEGGLAALQAFWRTWQVDIEVLRLLANAGDVDAQRQLARWPARSGGSTN